MTEKLKRGFATLDPVKHREIASKGGKSIPDEKRSFSQNRELASSAGRKGGMARQAIGRQQRDSLGKTGE